MKYPFIRPVSACGAGGDRHLGSSIVISSRAVVTCCHVLEQAIGGAHRTLETAEFEARLPSYVAIRDGLDARVSPAAAHVDRDKDMAILTFDRDLGVVPATIAIGFASPTVPRSFHAVGYPAEERGQGLQVSSFPSQHFRLQPRSERDRSVPTLMQIDGGVLPGNSGGAVLVEDGASFLVLGMIRQGGSITECRSTDALLAFLAERDHWPDSIVFWEGDAAYTGAGVLGAQRARIAQLLGHSAPLLELELSSLRYRQSFSLLPPGRIVGPEGEALVVRRPVAIMSAPLDQRLYRMLRQANAEGDGQMAAGLTRETVDGLAARLSELSGQNFRVPLLSEWWLGMTAGLGGAGDTGAARPYDGQSISARERPTNDWGVRPTPSLGREWVRPSRDTRPASFGPDGRRVSMGPGQTLSNLGVRFVVDLLPDPGERP